MSGSEGPMRSSKRPDLDRVHMQFVAWRRGRRRRAIPEHLWRAALELLDHHGSSTICQRLVLNPSRFKQMRETLGRARLRERRRGSARGERAEAGSRRPVFVELAPPGFGIPAARVQPVAWDTQRPSAECRLVVDSAGGSRLTVVLARADVAVIEAVCRSVLHVPGPAGR